MWITSDNNNSKRQFNLIASGVEDIEQCVSVLLGVIEGEVFLDRRLGTNIDLVDYPQNSLSLLYGKVFDKLEYYEPRINVKEVKIDKLSENGKVNLKVRIEIKEEVAG